MLFELIATVAQIGSWLAAEPNLAGRRDLGQAPARISLTVSRAMRPSSSVGML